MEIAVFLSIAFGFFAIGYALIDTIIKNSKNELQAEWFLPCVSGLWQKLRLFHI